jgi:hypothetical protein
MPFARRPSSAASPVGRLARPRPWLALALLLLAPACSRGPTKSDLYMEGLQIEGDAERGPCKLHYVEGQQAAALSGGQLANCLSRTKEALAKYDQAAELGLDDPDFVKVHLRAKERVVRLDEMVEQVRKMERGQE